MSGLLKADVGVQYADQSNQRRRRATRLARIREYASRAGSGVYRSASDSRSGGRGLLQGPVVHRRRAVHGYADAGVWRVLAFVLGWDEHGSGCAAGIHAAAEERADRDRK